MKYVGERKAQVVPPAGSYANLLRQATLCQMQTSAVTRLGVATIQKEYIPVLLYRNYVITHWS